MFFIIGPNTGLGHNSMIYMIECQVAYILDALQKIRAKTCKFIDVKPEVQEKFNREIQEKLGETVWSKGGCVSWYMNSSGKNTSLWPGFTFEFRKRTRKIKESDYEWIK